MALTSEEIAIAKGILEAAFTPLRCVAEGDDYNNRMKARVFDGEEALIRFHVSSSEARDRRELRQLIESVRDRLIDREYKLDPLPPA